MSAWGSPGARRTGLSGAGLALAALAAALVSWPVGSAESDVVARVGDRTISRE